jgi:hypothetical protein
MEPRIIANVSRSLFRAACAAFLFAAVTDHPAAAIEVAPCDASRGETFASAANVAISTSPMADDAGRSVLRIERPGADPRSIPLTGRAVGLTLTRDGSTAFAIVRLIDRKGKVKSVDLVRIDTAAGRASTALTLPVTARGVAISSDGNTLLVVARDELRTFRLPQLASGPLFGVAGENVGLAPLAGSSWAVVAQRGRLGLIDLSAAQGRDGLPLSSETVPPGALRGLMASAGESGPVALTDDGRAFCVKAAMPEPQATARVVAPPASAPEPAPPPIVAAPAVVPPAQPAPAEAAPPPVVEEERHDAPIPPPPVPQAAPEPTRDAPTAAGSVFGQLSGPSLSDVAAIVFLGPDNILHEAAREAPDATGRYQASGLAAGAYRIVAAGTGGRVLVCEPPFITVHVGGDGAVEAPVLKVVRAP